MHKTTCNIVDSVICDAFTNKNVTITEGLFGQNED